MSKRPPLELLQTKFWLCYAMKACGYTTPSKFGLSLEEEHVYTKGDVQAAFRAYKRGDQSVKLKLSDLNRQVQKIPKPSIEELETAFYDGPDLLFRSFDLPSNFPFNDRPFTDSSSLGQESTHPLALSIQYWMSAFDKLLATIHLEHVSKVQTQMFTRRSHNSDTKTMANKLRKKLPRPARTRPITLMPDAKLEVRNAINSLIEESTKSDIEYLKGSEILECAWDHAWFQAWQNYPAHIAEYALTQISDLMAPKIKTKQTSVKRGRLTNHIDEVIKLHESGINQTEIAKRFRVSRQAVSQALQQNKKATA